MTLCCSARRRLEGAATAQAQALRLMRASLRRGQYPLCCELLRFVVPPDADHETAGEEGEGGRPGLQKQILRFLSRLRGLCC